MNFSSPITSSSLAKWIPDARDFLRHQRYLNRYGTLNMPASFPKTLGRRRMSVTDQGVTDECTDHQQAARAGYRWSKYFSHRWQGAKESEVSGFPIVNGTDPRTTLKVPRIFGSLPVGYDPYSDDTAQATYLDWKGYDFALDKKAAPYLEIAYELIDQASGLDHFDSIRLALLQARADNETVSVFSSWYDEWNHTDGLAGMPTSHAVANHAHLFMDFDTLSGNGDVLVDHLSQGTGFGDNGFLSFPRAVVNSEVEKGNMAAYVFQTHPSTSQLVQTLLDLEETALDFATRVLTRITHK